MVRIDTVINAIKKNGPYDPEIEAILGCALAVIAVGVYEEEIEGIIGDRAGRSGDKQIEQFVRETLDGAFRTPSYSNIKDVLTNLDPKYKDKFAKTFIDKEVSDLNSLITLRHDVAHRGRVSANLDDVEKYYKSTLNIVRKLEKAME